MKVAFFDTKPYDKIYFSETVLGKESTIQFFPFRLNHETCNIAKGAQAVCIFVNDHLDRSCIKELSELGVEHIALRCAGFNNVDLKAAKEYAISVTRVPAYSPHAVAEHAIALILTLNRKTHRAYIRVREHNFSLSGLVGFDLHGKTVGIIGAGKIGQITAEILKSFGCHVLVNDPNLNTQWAQQHQFISAPFTEILQYSDIISLHLPLTDETHHLIDTQAFQSMKKGAYLINTGRGKLIHTSSLIKALKSGHLGGVALDVYEEEEGVFFEDLSDCILQDDELVRLLTFPNVLITSHQAFLTEEALAQIASTTCENLIRLKEKQAFLKDSVLA